MGMHAPAREELIVGEYQFIEDDATGEPFYRNGVETMIPKLRIGTTHTTRFNEWGKVETNSMLGMAV
jgi:hypothetical protein